MKHNIKRMLSLLLVLTAIVSLFTMPAAAAETEAKPPVTIVNGRIRLQLAPGVSYLYPEGFEMPTIYTGTEQSGGQKTGTIYNFFASVQDYKDCYDEYGVLNYLTMDEKYNNHRVVYQSLQDGITWFTDTAKYAFINGQIATTSGRWLSRLKENAFLRDDIFRNLIFVGKGTKPYEAIDANNVSYIGANAFKQSKLETIMFTRDWDGTHANAEKYSSHDQLFVNGMAHGKEALIIEEGAFSSCDNLTTVWFEKEPAALYIGPNAFANCPKLTIHAPAGGRIEAHCKAYGIKFESTGETANPQPYAGEPGGTIPLPYERYNIYELNPEGIPADNSAVKPGEGPGGNTQPPVITTPDHIGNFTDVPTTAWYAPAVQWASENGVVNGTSATTFTPDGQCTRAQIVQILYNQAGRPSVAGIKNKFSDVSDNAWYTPAVKWASANGVVNGTSATTFDPEAPCTRAQVVQILYNQAGRPDASGLSNPFTDVSNTAWYAPAVKWAAANKVVNGTGNGQFSPEGICTRAQVVQILYNISKA